MKLKLYLLVGLLLIHCSVFSKILGTTSAINADLCPFHLNLTEAPAAPEAKTPQIYAGTATLASLTATGTNLKWYAAPTGGEPVALTTALVDGSTYYVSQTVDELESERIAVTSKKISEGTQTLCNGATVANLTAAPSENSTIQWFTSATGGTALEETVAIASGTFYVQQVDLETSNRVGVNVIVESVQPLFRQVESICLGDELLPLPTVSLNGITGSWSPALNSGATTTYSFNPTPGQCVTDATVTMTILVNTAPNISYANVNTNYALGAAITPLVPNNTGGLPTPTNLATPLISDIYTANNQYILSISVDNLNNVFASDFYNSVFKITSSTTSTTIGNFNFPRGITHDAFGDVFVADRDANQIKKIAANGTITTLASGFSAPNDLVVDADGSIFVIDQQAVKKIATDGTISVVASGFHFRSIGLSLDNNSNIYVAETGHLNIKKIDPSGIITMLGGGYNQPSDVAADPVGNVYIADSFNNQIKRFGIDGTLTTLVSAFNGAGSVAVDSEGNVYYSNPNSIKKITFTTYSISPTLPEGLSFNSSTGVISGTPLAASNSTTYTISTMNSCGTNNATITFATCTNTAGVPTAITPVNYFNESVATPLTATTGTNGTGLLWYTTATGGTGSVTAPTPDTAILGTTSYWVSSTSENGCESARTEIVVTVTETVVLPDAPTVNGIQIYAGTSTIAYLTADGTNLRWYASATGGEPLEATTALVDGTTYYVSQTVDELESDRTAVTIKKISETNQTFCSGSGATVANLVASPSTDATLQWFATATEGTALAETTILVSGDYYIEQTQSENSTLVTSNRVLVVVSLETVETPTVETSLKIIQSSTAEALSAISSGSGLLWYNAATGGTGSTTAPTPDTATLGTTSYWVSSTSENGCESARSEIVVTIAIAAPKVQTPQIYAGTTTIASLTATGTNLQWYADVTEGAALASTTVLIDGSTYYVSQSSGTSESIRTAVTVRKISDASQTFCTSNEPMVEDLVTSPSSGATIKWFTSATEDTALPGTSVLVTGTYFIEQTLSDNTSNRVSVNVTIEDLEAPIVNTPISYAQGAVASALTATSAGSGLLWYVTETGGTSSTTAPTPNTTILGTTSYWVSSTNAAGCKSARTEIVVSIIQDILTIGSHPLDADITGGQNTSFTAAVNGVTINYQWQVSHDGGNTFTDLTNDDVYSGVTSAALTLTNVPISMHGKQYKVKVSNGSEVLSNAATLNVSVPDFNNTRFWKNKGMAGFSAGVAADSYLALDANNTPYVAFRDDSNGEKTSVMKFDGTSWVLVGGAGFSETNFVYSFSMVFDASNMPYVAYLNANNSIEVKYFNGTSWTNVGVSGLESGAEGLSLKMDPSGVPFVAYTDYSANYKTSVRKLVGNSWVLVGDAGFSAGESYDTSFAIDSQGTPYVVYRDESNDGKATAMKFDGTAWVSVGSSSGFSPDVAFFTSLTIDRAGTPYAAFVDYYTDEPVVMKFNGIGWVMVGTPGFASGALYSSSIALDGSGTPFLVYQDFDNSNKVTVKRFDGTSWTTVGESGFSMGAGNFPAIDLDSSGTPYVVFIDAALGNKVTVMKFNGSNVETIWENGSWDNGEPSFTMKAIIDDTLVLSADLEASALEVTTNGSITVATGTVLTVSGEIINNNTAAHFVVEDHGILLQQQDVQNEGDITVNVNSFPLYRQDYTLWSTPVKEQNLRSFSLQTLFNRFSSYDTAAGTGANPVGAYVQEIFTTADMAAKTFTTANGYLIRMPNNWDDYVDNSIPGVSYPGVFKGVPQNGTISRALSTSNVGLNLVGNPYPSPISIDAFFDGNPGVEQTIYYWRKRNDASGSGYATFNALGFVSAQSEINNLDMEYVINPGQGFFIKTTGATQLNFNNTMRSSNSGGLFLRNAPEDKHRLWLRLSNSTGSVGQTLIGYTAGATANVDNGLDAAYFNDSSTALTSLIDNNEYIIQGLGLPFDVTSNVPLGFKTDVAGTYTISLGTFDGLFAENQNIYLKDNVTGDVHNVKESAYNFTASEGVFNSRFEVVYQNSVLGTDNPDLAINKVLVYKEGEGIQINSMQVVMQKVELYDVRGSLLQVLDDVNESKATFSNLAIANQIVLVKITAVDGKVTTRKIVF